MKKTIAIIGAAGNMGSALAHSLAGSGNRILLAGHDNDSKLSSLLTDIKKNIPDADVDILDCSHEASWEADIIIPAVPYAAQPDVALRIKDVVTGKIVISIVNPLNSTYDGLLTAPDTSAAEELAGLLPHSKIVKAFNTIFSPVFSAPEINGNAPDSFIAGDDNDAVETVAGLVREAGFNPVPAGRLSVSRTLENMCLLLIQLNQRYNYNWRAGWKVLH